MADAGDFGGSVSEEKHIMSKNEQSISSHHVRKLAQGKSV